MSNDRPDDAAAPDASWWVPAAVLVLVALVQLAVVTDGFRVSLFQPDGPSHYFDAFADSLFAGRVDVDPYHVGNEAFVVDEVAYGYFGITPSLLRMPLHVLFPSMWGQWSRVFMVLAGLLTVLGAHLLVVYGRSPGAGSVSTPARLFHAAFLLTVGVGSSSVFLPSRPNVFHEANALGAALAILSYAALTRYLRTPSLAGVAGVLVLCFFALHARVIAGAGVVLAIGFVIAMLLLRASGHASSLVRLAGLEEVTQPRRHAAALALGLVLVAGSYGGLNWAKFGTLLSIPIENNLQSTPERMAKTSGQMLRAGNVLSNAYTYLMPWNVRFGADAPHIRPVPREELMVLPGARFDWREPVVAISAASPGLLALSGFGVAWLVAGWRRGRGSPPMPACVFGGLASASVPLAYFAITQRYGHDMLPFLVVTAAAAVVVAERAPAAKLRPWALGLLLATGWSALVWQDVGDAYRQWGSFIKLRPYRDAVMIPIYEKSLERDPGRPLVHAELGAIEQQLGRPERALPHLVRALELDPDCDPALVALALQRWPSDLAGATALLTRAVEANPYSSSGRLFLGQALLQGGRAAEAVPHLLEAVELEPRDERAHRALQEALSRSR